MNALIDRHGAKKPNPVDVHIGGRVRMARMLAGVSQEKLGEILGLTFQQVQKYEKGANRIGGSRLYQIASALGRDPGYFFEGLDRPATDGTSPDAAATLEALQKDTTRQSIELLRAFAKIPAAALRRAALELVKAIADPARATQDEGSAP